MMVTTTRAQYAALRALRKRHTIVRTYQEQYTPGRLFAYTGEYNGVEIAIRPNGVIYGEPDEGDV